MSLQMELRVDLGDGEFILEYDSEKTPMGVSIGLASDDKLLMIKRVDLNHLAELLVKSKKTFLMASYEEAEPEEEDDEDG